MKQLIINADDFGMTSGVNRAVIEGHTRGVITSATIMANMPAFDEAVRLAKTHPTLGVGLHFNITQGRPVSEPEQVISLTTERGEFLETSAALAKRSLLGTLQSKEVVRELRAQLEKVQAAGLRLTHIDSHKHSHALPQISSAIAETIGDYGIAAVRLPREKWRLGSQLSPKPFVQSLVALGLANLCRAGEKRLRERGVLTTDHFFGVAQTGFWSKKWLRRLIETLPDGSSELMSHPGYADDLQTVATRLRESRTVELQLLIDQEVKQLIESRGITLINYSQLGWRSRF